jgi:hypothetical protein
MGDEMRGLMCGTSIDLTYDDDETASEESTTLEDSVKRTRVELSPVSENLNPTVSDHSSGVTCNVCTTRHLPPLPVCCETCLNVLEPEKLTKEQIWNCTDNECHGAEVGYINYIDAGRCGVCGAKRN